jgi:isopenicillin-N epimerase
MRDLFLLDPTLTFLNHGSFGACPREVLDDQRRWQLDMERNPVDFLGRRSGALLHHARQVLAQYLGAQTPDLVFVPNTTTGVNTVAQSFPLQAGDEILTTDLEYGACDAAWQRTCRQTGAIYKRVAIPLPYQREDITRRLMAAITPHTKLISFSHITSATALTLPAADICAAARQQGIATFVDGAHAPGHIPLDLDAIGADFYVGNCHKWLCAPKGSAFLHARVERQPMLHATVASWGYAEGTEGVASFKAYLGSTPFERRLQWQGTRDITPWLAVPAAIDFQARHDWPAVRARCHALARQALHDITQHLGTQPMAHDDDWAQMVAIPVGPQDPGALQQRLFEAHRIEVPVTTHGDQVFVRISVQGYNTAEEVARLVAAVSTNAIN